MNLDEIRKQKQKFLRNVTFLSLSVSFIIPIIIDECNIYIYIYIYIYICCNYNAIKFIFF